MPPASLLVHGGGASRRQCQSVVSEELAASGHLNESAGSLSSNVPILVHAHNSRLGRPRFATFAELRVDYFASVLYDICSQAPKII